MSDNPFRSIVTESVNKAGKIERSISILERYLSKASEALNESIQGQSKIHLKTTFIKGTLNVLDTFEIHDFNDDPKKKFIFLTNENKSKLIATIKFEEDGEDMSLVFNKLKSTYPTSNEGFISCIGSILSTTSFIECAVKLRTEIKEGNR